MQRATFCGRNVARCTLHRGEAAYTAALLRNWAIVSAGRLAGAPGTAALVFLGRQHPFGGGAVGVAALGIAHAKVGSAC